MSTKNTTKINRLVSNWPRGVVYTQKYLTELGYDHSLVKRYRKSGWIEKIGGGAFKLTNDNVSWQGGLVALQTQLALEVHIGGKTALELQGYMHFVSQKRSRVDLFGKTGKILPKWFTSHPWGVRLNYHAAELFSKRITGSIIKMRSFDLEYEASIPERAVLEMLYEVPKKQSMAEAKLIMDMLLTLRSPLMQNLLENCNSIKVKRLFLYFADNLNLPVFQELRLDHINLGAGKRQIVVNGALDKKYKITVPRDLFDGE